MQFKFLFVINYYVKVKPITFFFIIGLVSDLLATSLNPAFWNADAVPV